MIYKVTIEQKDAEYSFSNKIVLQCASWGAVSAIAKTVEAVGKPVPTVFRVEAENPVKEVNDDDWE